MELNVERFLKELRISYRLIKLRETAFSVADVVLYSDGAINPEEICKTIIVKGKKSAKLRACLLRGGDKLDFSKLKRVFDEEASIASSEEVKEAASVEPGAVCPFMLSVSLYADQRVLSLERINCGSGDHLYGLEVNLKDFLRTSSPVIADIARRLSV